MMFKTHLAFGFLLSLLAIKYLNIENQILFAMIVVFFSVFPDIDNHKSKVGKKAGILSNIIEIIFKHRGIVHSPWIPIISYIILASINQWLLGAAVLLGYFSHLLLDTLTRQGIMPLYPLTKKSLSGFLKSDGIADLLLFLVFGVAGIYTLVKVL